VEYARRTADRWPQRWGDARTVRSELEHALAGALVDFLEAEGDGRRVVSKTPSLDNLALLARLRPPADVVVVVRDGRSVTSSLTAGFRWSFRKAALEWRRGARALLEYRALPEPERAALRVHEVRYEDFAAGDVEPAVRALLEFTGLDPDRFDWDAARSLPVIGSSFVRDADGRLTWEPVARDQTFDPTARFRGWSAARRARFRDLAGSEQAALGYDVPPPAAPGWLWYAYNRAADAVAPLVALRDEWTGRYFQWKARRRRR
jgi:hypothetical protein